MSIKERVPWYLKIPAKIALSRLPVSRHVWRRLGIFRHGTMDDPASALGVCARRWSPGKGVMPIERGGGRRRRVGRAV